MIKAIKHIISLCAVTSLFALSFIGCSQPTIPETKYKVSFNINEHGIQPDAIEVTENTILTKEQLPTLTTKDDFTFGGWLDENGELVSDKYKVTKNVTLKAKWTENTYTVTFDANGHGTAPTSIPNLKKGDLVTQPENLTPTDQFNFKGWYKEPECKNAWDFKTDTVSSNVTIYAKWEEWEKVPNLIFSNPDGSEIVKGSSVTFGYSEADYKEYTIHFSINGGEYQSETSRFIRQYITEDITISAYASKDGMKNSDTVTVKYTLPRANVKFHNYGHGKAPESIKIKHGSKIQEPKTMTENNFKFVGWFKDEKLIEPWDFENDTITTDVTLYAKWSIMLNGKQINFGDIILNDGSIVPVTKSTELTEQQKNQAVAVVCGLDTNGKILGLGLKQSGEYLKWTTSQKGFETNFKNIATTVTPLANPHYIFVNPFEFSGDLNGSDNWDEICNVDKEDTKDAAKNYPAFNWVNNYGNTYVTHQDYKTGWYIPSIAEATDIVRNQTAINEGLQKLGTDKTTQLSPSLYFWSSSQVPNTDVYVWTINMQGLLMTSRKADNLQKVLCIRAF